MAGKVGVSVEERISWEEFKEIGLLFLINTMLYAFGIAIVIDGNTAYLVAIESYNRDKVKALIRPTETEG